MVATTQTTFEPLPIRRRTLVPVDPNQYNVTASLSETKQIKAGTAYEAFKLSGFRDAIKIERISNLTQPLLGKEQFIDDAMVGVFTDVIPQEGEALLRVKRRNLIVSADELDALMHTLQEIAAHVPVVSPALVPEAAAIAQGTVGPTGMDVHGEGFDEIIPSSPATKPVMVSKPVESKEAAAGNPPPSAAPPLPERELSQEEIEKLLGGK